MIRDEIVERLYGRCQHCTASIGGSVRVLSCSVCDAIADALLPIVERVVLESARQMAGYCVAELAPSLIMPTEKLLEAADRIVQKLMEGGQ